MDKNILEIHNLHASINDVPILQGFELSLPYGEVHAIMGPNGAGKSTLAKILAGHPSYEITDGSIHFNGKDLLALSVDERAHLGLFMSFQYPIEIAGVSNSKFLRLALNAQRKANGLLELTNEEFDKRLQKVMQQMQIPLEFLERSLNVGFSGGEKKKNEILQMALFEPALSVLDETDSGLDIDALRFVADSVNAQRSLKRSMLIITHYKRLLDYIRPDRVHVMAKGQIVHSGGFDLAIALEEKGYEGI